MTATEPLGQVFKISKGKKAAKVTDEPIAGTLPYIQIDEVRGTRPSKYVIDPKAVEVTEDDLCIVWDGANAGTVGYGVKGAIGSTVARMRLKQPERWEPRFLGRLLGSKFQELNDQAQARGATIPHVDKAKLEEIAFPKIDRDEQCRIAAILDKADAIRRKRQQALALADDLLKSVFLDMFGDPHRNPHNFPIREFETLLTIPLRNGISPSSKGSVSASVLTLSAITGEGFDATQIKEGKFLKPISKTDQVDVGDFYICRGNGSPDLVGKGYFASKSMDGVAFPDTMIAAKINTEQVCRGFFEMIWNSQFVRGQIIEAARTTNGTYKINQTATGGIRIPTPPKATQETFEDVFRKVHDLREQLSFEDDLFASLSQRAFRGEL